MTDPEEGRAWRAQRAHQCFRCFYAIFSTPPQGQYPGSNLRVAPEEYRWVRRDKPRMKAEPGGRTLRGTSPPLGRRCWDTGETLS